MLTFSTTNWLHDSLPHLAAGMLARLLLAAVLTAGLTGCGSSGQALDEMPDWATDKPDSEQFIYGTGTGTSSNLQSALDKADLRAQADIASTLEDQVEELRRGFREDVNGNESEQFTQALEQVTSQVLRGVTSEETKVIEDGDGYRSYALVKMPIGEAYKKLLNQLDQGASTRLRKSEAFEQLKKEVEKYESAREE